MLNRSMIMLGLIAALFAGCDKHQSKKSSTIPPVALLPTQSPLTDPPALPPTAPLTLAKDTVAKDPRIQALWAVALNNGKIPCSSFYDFRDDKKLDVHLLCISADKKSLQMETHRYGFVQMNSKTMVYELTSSSCSDRKILEKLYLTATLNTDNTETGEQLLLSESQSFTPAMKKIDAESLAGDLISSNSLHGLPLTRGCFLGAALDKFKSNEAVR